MLALASLIGLRVNFLDFVALPLTLGIGADYAANMVARGRQDRTASARALLTTTGGAVFLCSLTTIIGYGSLLLSENRGIRSFGAAAILGEATCLWTGLFVAPALVQWLHRHRPARGTKGWSHDRAPRIT
jgi:predicted RND superfamily exporter protein